MQNTRDAQAGSQRSVPRNGTLASSVWTATACALVGGLLSWWLVQSLHPIYNVPPELTAKLMFDLSPEDAAAIKASQLQVSFRNSFLVLGWTGALLAGFLALGEALSRRSWRMLLFGVAAAVLVGAICGGLAGWAGHVVYQNLKAQDPGAIGLKGATMVQLAMMAALGAGVGLAMGSLTRRIGASVTCLLGGAVAGAAAGLLYPTAVALFLRGAHTERIVPLESVNALLWLGLVALLLGIILPGMTAQRKPKPSTAAAGSESGAGQE